MQIELYLRGNSFIYELSNVAKMYFGSAVERTGKPDKGASFAYLAVSRNTRRVKLYCLVKHGSTVVCSKRLPPDASVGTQELTLALIFYDALVKLFGYEQPWGVMTGVRPAKFASQNILKYGETEARKVFTDKYRVSREKTDLSFDVAKRTGILENKLDKNGYSLYVSIPFCPSRCSYCSFVSQTVERDVGLLESYLQCLLSEIRCVSELSQGKPPQTIYIGGGTPTVLSAVQLTSLTKTIEQCFDLSKVEEYTIEAGRPDTLSKEKLVVIKQAGCTRISINPQTMSDKVLEAVGRRHTAADVTSMFALARSYGFTNINCDLIAGLPTDTQDGFRYSLDRIIDLRPENLTVHSLTIKRASRLNQSGGEHAGGVGKMLEYAADALPRAGYSPYYMYKQKATIENLENVGWALDGKECLYNVFIMEELQTIVACGAGAVSKLVAPDGKISRSFNMKLPLEYIAGIDEMIKRKKTFMSR